MPLNFRGLDLYNAINRLLPGKCAVSQNVRAYSGGGVQFRNLLTDPISYPFIESPSPAMSSTGTPGWTTPANATSATLFTTTSSATFSTLNGTISGLSIPSGAIINGIGFSFDALNSPNFSNTVVGSITVNSVSSTGQASGLIPAAAGPLSLGGATSLWGLTITPAFLNAGWSFQFITNGALSSTISLNNLVVTIYYTAPFVAPSPIHSIRRLNDSTPNGPASGYTLIVGAGENIYAGEDEVATGLSGNPVSIIPFRPNTSVQPWAYIGDSAPQGNVTIDTQYLVTTGPHANAPVDFISNGLLKIRSDGRGYKSGVKEPQLAPVVSTQNTSVTSTGTLEATAVPWNNYTGANSDYNFGQTDAYNGQPGGIAPFDGTVWFAVDVLNASFVTITSLTGSATINGGTKTPSSLGPSPSTATNPGHYIMTKGTGATPPATATVVVGAFTDGNGNVIPAGVAPLFIPSVVDVGAVIGVSDAITVPFGAVAFQIGINSTGNTYSANSGSFALSVTVTTNALPSVTSILGLLLLYYWGDSPNSGGVASYLWKNPDDPSGSGPVRSISNANGSVSNNSFVFDATFTAGLPGLPGVGNENQAMQWTTLTPESVASGSIPVFPSPLITTYPNNTNYDNFNFCVFGNIYFPQAGNYTFVLTNHDDIIWGIGGGVTLVSATPSGSGESGSVGLSSSGQTITVVNGYPLLPRQNYSSGEGGDYAQTTVVVSVPSAGIYPIEIDYDYWFHSGRILLLDASPTPGAGATIIPPLPSNVRQDVQYRYVYRSSATGATSNPSPESAAETIPVTANTITSIWSPDPQVDVVDYYRIDSVTADFTYVATGPNDDLGTVPGTNTPITDSLTDTELGTQLLDFSNFEPFPSIDLPQKGVVNVSGGVITWVSGGAIGGSATGFNLRWLAGTTILIGSPTSLAYIFIARPTSTTTVTIPGVPDGTNLAYEIPQPILANQPLPILFGPTDNINFTFGLGDPLRPGTLYWCAGSNLDAAPDTNQLDVCSPSEPLMGGDMSGGRGVLFSITRGWVIMPNFYNATATSTGVEGSTWTLQATAITRGLFMPRCVSVEGSGKIFFRVSDGIHMSPGGGASKSITDDDLYPLFPHENEDGGTSVPQPVTREGVTVYPPDDTQPQLQKFKVIGQYLYYDYVGTDDIPHTMVFDIDNLGFVWDLYDPPATCHAANDGVSTQGTIVGCEDGTVRLMASEGTETGTAIIMSPAIGGKGWQHARQVIVEYSSTATITLTLFPADSGSGSYGPPPMTLPNTSGALTKLKLDSGPAPNKWRLAWFMFSSTEPFTINLDGFVCYVKDWGSSGPYKPMQPFAGEGGGG